MFNQIQVATRARLSIQTHGSQATSLANIVEQIRSDVGLINYVNAYRAALAISNEQASKIKSHFPVFHPSVTFKAGKPADKASVELYNGCVCLDFDPVVKGQTPVVKSALITYPEIAVAFTSPSGGLKVIIRTDNTSVNSHSAITAQLISKYDAFACAHNLRIDNASKNAVQACFLTHDADVYINEQSEIYVCQTVEITQPTMNDAKPVNFNGDDIGANAFARYITRHYASGTDAAKDIISRASWFGCSIQDCQYICAAAGMKQDDIDRIPSIYKSASDSFAGYIASINASVTQSVIATHELQDNQNLNELDLFIPHVKRHLIVAPTGCGKSHLDFRQWPKKKQIWLFPTVPLAEEQFESKSAAGKRVLTCWSNSHNSINSASSFNDVDIIIGTYDAANDIIAALAIAGALTEFMLIVDEFHNLVSAAGKQFRNKAVKSVIDAIKTLTANHVVGLTATPIANRHYLLSLFEVTKVIKRELINKTYQVVNVPQRTKETQMMKHIADSINSPVHANAVSIVYVQTTKTTDIAKWQKALSGNKKVVVVNSKVRNTPDAAEFFASKHASEQSVYLVTSLIAEGVNIVNPIKTVNIYVTESTQPLLIEQLAKRFRKAETVNVVRYVRESEHDDNKSSIEIESEHMSSKIRDEHKAYLVNEFNEKYASIRIDTLEHIMKYDPDLLAFPGHFDKELKTFVIDNEAFEQAIFDRTSKAYKQSKLAYEQYLKQYAFNILKDLHLDRNAESVVIESQKYNQASLFDAMKHISLRNNSNIDVQHVAQEIERVAKMLHVSLENAVELIQERTLIDGGKINLSDVNELQWELVSAVAPVSFLTSVNQIKKHFAGKRMKKTEAIDVLESAFSEFCIEYSGLLKTKRAKTAFLTRLVGMKEGRTGDDRFVQF